MLLCQRVNPVKIYMRIVDGFQVVMQPLGLGKGLVGDGVLRAVFCR